MFQYISDKIIKYLCNYEINFFLLYIFTSVIKLPIFVLEMNKWLKYLLLIAPITFFWNDKMSHKEKDFMGLLINETLSHSIISPFDSELCLPLQDNSSYAYRLQSIAKKKPGEHNPDFIKSAKIVCAGIRYFSQNTPFIAHGFLLEPVRKLIYLCKLII